MDDGQFANMTSVPRSDGFSAKNIKTTGWSSGRTEVTRRLLQFVQFLIGNWNSSAGSIAFADVLR